VFLKFGIGPSFRYSTLGLTSNQSASGGGIPSTAQSQWLVGVVASVGVSAWVCSSCMAGNPLDVGLEGRMRYFGAQSVSLTSPAFGFIETGTVGSHPEFSLRLKVGVPILIR
jgi:hypothetical protein